MRRGKDSRVMYSLAQLRGTRGERRKERKFVQGAYAVPDMKPKGRVILSFKSCVFPL
jgi:hypothetical protein